MATFTIGTDISTTTSSIDVTVDPAKPLAVGKQRFRLVVVDDSGNSSLPADVLITVADKGAPTAVIEASSSIVMTGASFRLDGSKSFDTGGGKVVKYIWTYVGPA